MRRTRGSSSITASTAARVPSLEPSSTKITSVPAPMFGMRRAHSATLPSSLWQGTTTDTESFARGMRGLAARYCVDDAYRSTGISGRTAFSRLPMTGTRLGTGRARPASTTSNPWTWRTLAMSRLVMKFLGDPGVRSPTRLPTFRIGDQRGLLVVMRMRVCSVTASRRLSKSS